jgi:hypothetical protein
MPIELQFILWLIFAACTGKVASGRGRSVVLWSFLGAALWAVRLADGPLAPKDHTSVRRRHPAVPARPNQVTVGDVRVVHGPTSYLLPQRR